ncbi:MAG: MBL fold metallo-hydrolase [Lachnospiraceae bacterium]|nr:MBL fold metallo-hydrolase [Lachnospiraceae bacterium]
MKMMTIASGSSGNSTLIQSDSSAVLIDCGISKKRIEEALSSVDMSLYDIDGIFITHEHTDHVSAVGVIARTYGLKMYATEETIRAISRIKSLGNFDRSLFTAIDPMKSVQVGDLSVRAYPVWHDAADPVCYTVTDGHRKVSVATDMGDYDDGLVREISGSDAMVIETNHDIRMLQVGRYSYDLKQRILGKRGHLSNEAGGRLIRSVLNNHIRAIFLGHLSKDNNLPELAYEAVKYELNGNPYSSDVRDFNISVAPRDTAGPLITI